jgi:hypothetical protein
MSVSGLNLKPWVEGEEIPRGANAYARDVGMDYDVWGTSKIFPVLYLRKK